MKNLLLIARLARNHSLTLRSLQFLSRPYSSWTPFSLDDELTLHVKKAIEDKWGKRVYGIGSPSEEQQRNAKLQGPQTEKSYILSMFPYPSGKLHLGHLRIYTLSDVLARYHRLKGEEVVHPIGWDAFGLPAENAARDNGIEPETWTRDNIDYMKQQILRMGCSFDWEREFATCDPTYYKWTQWLFIKLWEHGLAYKKRAYVFWDPVDETVLAEEQVDSEMRSWRSGAKVEKRLLEQWYIRTCVFAKELADCLEANALRQGWRDIVDMQKHWIGPIQGRFTDCPILTTDSNTDAVPVGEFLRLWFSSPDALRTSKFVLLQPNHYINHSDSHTLRTFPNGVKQMALFIQNPITGEGLPIFSASASLPLPLIPESSDCRIDEILSGEIYGELAAQEDQMEEITSILSSAQKYSGQLKEVKNFVHFPSSLKLRDWLISRQRKWGTPIPAISCLDCGHASILPTAQLPVSHAVSEYPVCYNKGKAKPVQAPSKQICPNCGSRNTKRETDTLDTFFDSSWYFLRYLDAQNETAIYEPVKVDPWIPVRTYVGGKEHATLHLYYARFMSHFLHSLNMLPAKEPFKVLVPVGVVMGETFVTKSGKYIGADQVEEVFADGSKKLIEKSSGSSVTLKWEKMSKSKHNGIDPDVILEEFGIDSLRLLSMADVAPQSVRKWTPQSFNAYLKFQNKVWCAVRDFVAAKESEEDIIQFIAEEDWHKMEAEISDARNYHLKSVTFNMEVTSQISVAITKLLGIATALRKIPKAAIKDSFEFERALGTLIIALYPVMPAFCAQLWQYFRDVANLTESEFDLENEVWCQKWPEVDRDYKLDLIVLIRSEEVDIVKVERHILDSLDSTVGLEFALESEKVSQLLSRESVSVTSLRIEPGYRATINLKDPNAPPRKLSLKKKSKKTARESTTQTN